MARLRGNSIGTGLILGTVAIIQELNGIPVAPQPPARIIKEQVLRRGAAEKPDLILVARDCRTAAALAPLITWGRVAAIVSETTAILADLPGVPSIGDVDGVMSAVSEDMLLLVDASGGFLFPDPDPVFLAHYTATAANLAPRKRIYLDAGHEQVRTQDGVLIHVLGIADSAEEAEAGASCGADGLLLGSGTNGATVDLTTAASAAASGKELLVWCGTRCNTDSLIDPGNSRLITLVLTIDESQSIAQAQSLFRSMQERVNTLLEADEPVAMPATAVAINVEMLTETHEDGSEEAIARVLDACEAVRASRLILGCESESLGEGLLGLMDPWIVAATNRALPVYVVCRSISLNPFGFGSLENTLPCASSLLIGAGVTGIAVNPQDVQLLKMAAREQNTEECRTAFRQALKEINGQ